MTCHRFCLFSSAMDAPIGKGVTVVSNDGMSLRCPYCPIICRGALVNSAEGAEAGKALMHQQAVAGSLPSAEDAAAATTEQQARASSSAAPSAPASSTATPSQAGNGSAAVSNTPAASDNGSMHPGQHSSEPQPARQLPQAAQGNVGASRNSTSKARKQQPRGMRQANVATPQAASDSTPPGRFQGFE